MKRILAIGIILLFIGMSISSSTGFNTIEQPITTTSNGKTLYVGGSGPNNYTKIQYAIDDASDGDTVFVYDDSSPYYEHVTVNKRINLIGEDKNTTVIDGSDIGDVVLISADNVNMSSFKIQNGGYIIDIGIHDAGIEVKSDYNNIFENIIINTSSQIYLNGANYNNIINNTIESRRLVNWPTDNIETGVLVNGNRNIIANNTIRFNYVGIYIHPEDNNNLIVGNALLHNTVQGLYDHHSANTVIWNTIADNGRESLGQWSVGILKTDDFSVFHHNDLFFNYRNAFVDNGRFNNTWDDGSEGNYWDDWDANPGYPDTYILPGWSVDVDYHPSPTRWNDVFVADGYGLGPIYKKRIYVLVNNSIDFNVRKKGGVPPYSWFWDFGDGNTSDEKDTSHSYAKSGIYMVFFTAIDNASHSDTDRIIISVGTGPPYAPNITGRKLGRTGKMYYYTLNATDPDGDDIYYTIEWGDGNYYDDWGPIKSGWEIDVPYQWSKVGNYTIRACARDPTYTYGPWATFEVTMPKNRNVFFSRWLERFPLLNQFIIRIMERWSI